MESTTLPCPPEVLDLEQFQAQSISAKKKLHLTEVDLSCSSQAAIVHQPDRLTRQLRVLFLCRQNNARSQMAEALLLT